MSRSGTCTLSSFGFFFSQLSVSRSKGQKPPRPSQVEIRHEICRNCCLGPGPVPISQTLGILGVVLRKGNLQRLHQWFLCHCRQTKSVSSAEEFGCNGRACGGGRALLFEQGCQRFDASYHSVCSWKTFSELLVAWGEAAAHCGVSSDIQNSSTLFQCSIPGSW